MRSRYIYATKLADKVLTSFLCLSALKNKIVESTIKEKSKYPLFISSIRILAISIKTTLPKTKNPCGNLANKSLKISGGNNQ